MKDGGRGKEGQRVLLGPFTETKHHGLWSPCKHRIPIIMPSKEDTVSRSPDCRKATDRPQSPYPFNCLYALSSCRDISILYFYKTHPGGQREGFSKSSLPQNGHSLQLKSQIPAFHPCPHTPSDLKVNWGDQKGVFVIYFRGFLCTRPYTTPQEPDLDR